MVDICPKDKARPYHARYLPIPVIHIEPFLKKLDRLVTIGVLARVNCIERATHIFIIPKKDGQVIFISDFRGLNKKTKCTPYTITHIKDMLHKLSNFSYATTLDLMISYYNISLTDAAKKVCTITTLFVKYEYNFLPMGFCIAPDVFQ